jgi:membrane protease YdiL (CAAX protease family)
VSGRVRGLFEIIAVLVLTIAAAELAVAKIPGPRFLGPLWGGYLSHLAYFAIPALWLLIRRERVPVGRLTLRELRPWVSGWAWLLLLQIAFHAGIYQPAMAAMLRMPLSGWLATLVFQGVWVGLSEEFLFRGYLQTSLALVFPHPLHRGKRLIGAHVIVASLLFGALHLVNLTYQPLEFTLIQAGEAAIFGLIIGSYYDRNRNLWGAAIAHNLANLTFFGVVALRAVFGV